MEDNLLYLITKIKLELEKIQIEKKELYIKIEILKKEKETILNQMKNQNNFDGFNEVGYLREKISFLEKEVENCIKLIEKI